MFPLFGTSPAKGVRLFGARMRPAAVQPMGFVRGSENEAVTAPAVRSWQFDERPFVSSMRLPLTRIPRLPKGVVLDVPVVFQASSLDYAVLWLKNMFWMLLTAGLYLPWARVRAQRFFMRHTWVGGHRLDYHADPSRLFLRYALVFSLMVGVLGAWLGSVWAGMLALSLAIGVWPMLVFMKWTHRMAHVSWDKRRLAFDGCYQGVYRALAWPLITLAVMAWVFFGGLTLPGAMTWARGAGGALLVTVWLALVPSMTWGWLQYRQHHLRLGPWVMLWKASRAAVRGLYLFVFMWALLTFGVGVVVLSGLLWAQSVMPTPLFKGLVSVMAVLVLVAWHAYADACMRNLVWRKTGNRYLRVRSRLSVYGYVGLQLRHAVLLLVTGGLYWPWAVVASHRMRLRALTVYSRVDANVLKAHWPTYSMSVASKMQG